MTLRLDHELQKEIDQERKALRVSRSELVRQALKEFFERRAERKFMAELARAAKLRDPDKDRAIAEEALYLDNEAMSMAEGGHSMKLSYRKPQPVRAKRS